MEFYRRYVVCMVVVVRGHGGGGGDKLVPPWGNIFTLFGCLSFKRGKLHYFKALFPAVLMVRIFANGSLSNIEKTMEELT